MIVETDFVPGFFGAGVGGEGFAELNGLWDVEDLLGEVGRLAGADVGTAEDQRGRGSGVASAFEHTGELLDAFASEFAVVIALTMFGVGGDAVAKKIELHLLHGLPEFFDPSRGDLPVLTSRTSAVELIDVGGGTNEADDIGVDASAGEDVELRRGSIRKVVEMGDARGPIGRVAVGAGGSVGEQGVELRKVLELGDGGEGIGCFFEGSLMSGIQLRCGVEQAHGGGEVNVAGGGKTHDEAVNREVGDVGDVVDHAGEFRLRGLIGVGFADHHSERDVGDGDDGFDEIERRGEAFLIESDAELQAIGTSAFGFERVGESGTDDFEQRHLMIVT